MNRLIIIGNGFDLAHGLKTSFKDFIEHYLYTALCEVQKKRIYSDELISIAIKKNYFTDFHSIDINIGNVHDVLQRIKENDSYEIKFFTLFNYIYRDFIGKKWVDIEQIYFDLLIQFKKGNNGISNTEVLNRQLGFIKKKLVEYLRTLDIENTETIDLYNDYFFHKVDFTNANVADDELDILTSGNRIIILNFNYTNLIEKYKSDLIRHSIIYIHGSLCGKHGEPIFGYGDEHHEEYADFEKFNSDSIYQYIKSFEYLLNYNYTSLRYFLESGDYETHIYGHSCGKSDRTILNYIFEHNNCKSIQLFFFKKDDGSTDFIDKTYSISKIFKDKTRLRNLLSPLTISAEMPQKRVDN